MNYWTEIFQSQCWKANISETFTYHQWVNKQFTLDASSQWNWTINCQHTPRSGFLKMQNFFSSNVCQCLGIFGVITTGQLREGHHLRLLDWGRGTVKRPTMYMTDLNNKKCSGLHINNAKSWRKPAIGDASSIYCRHLQCTIKIKTFSSQNRLCTTLFLIALHHPLRFKTIESNVRPVSFISLNKNPCKVSISHHRSPHVPASFPPFENHPTMDFSINFLIAVSILLVMLIFFLLHIYAPGNLPKLP